MSGSIGTASAQYQIVDDNNGVGPAQVSQAAVTFDYQNGPPTAQSDGDPTLAANTPQGYHLTGHDPDGDPLTFLVDSVTGPPGDASPLFHFNNADGTFNFDGGPAGTWVITFRVFDGNTASSPATFTITTN